MVKYFRKRIVRGSRDKYSVEHTTVSIQTPNVVTSGLYQAATNICPASALQGMRKVKHITASLTTGNEDHNLFWSIVFVPEGYSPNTMNGNPGASLYEPNQFVMACGVNDPSAGPVRIRTPISRNLNSGDSIWLIVGTQVPNSSIAGVVQYAVTLQ